MQSNFEIFGFSRQTLVPEFDQPPFYIRSSKPDDDPVFHIAGPGSSLALGLAEVRYDLFQGDLESELRVWFGSFFIELRIWPFQ